MKNKLQLNKMKKNYCKIPVKLFYINLSPTAVSIYCFMASHTEEFNPSIKFIAKTLNIAKGTVIRYITELENRNIIKCIRRGGSKIVTEYEFCYIKDWKDSGQEKNYI